MPPARPWGGLVFDRRDAAEVAVFEAVAIALQREDFGVVHEAVDHLRGHRLSTLYARYASSRGIPLTTYVGDLSETRAVPQLANVERAPGDLLQRPRPGAVSHFRHRRN
jgi:hypothetical protein